MLGARRAQPSPLPLVPTSPLALSLQGGAKSVLKEVEDGVAGSAAAAAAAAGGAVKAVGGAALGKVLSQPRKPVEATRLGASPAPPPSEGKKKGGLFKRIGRVFS